ncbi:MAG: UDP-N-acetylglucosamine 2-epimerase (non-hydrolyzing) [Alphaproteobacteria bacterium]|nr:UDP-N-acetylglucosamine 2-epimerase (non-hydrolyzing) [Alphaproteobacteria bacterium]
MLKVMTILGTRPELIKMSRVIATFDKHTQHILVHTGQNYDYELNQVFFEDLGIRKPDYFLEAVGTNAAQTIGRVIEKADAVMEKTAPDAIMIYGDTNSGMAVIAAKRRKIPIFHMEAGNRCFDPNVPEELNRKVIDHLSDINLTLTEQARRNLLAEGLPAERTIKTGSHMAEVLEHYKVKIAYSQILKQLNLRSRDYFLVSAHREENVDDPENLKMLLNTLEALVKTYDKTVIVSTHPRTQKQLESIGISNLDKRIHFLKPFGFFDYVKLQSEALCVLSDSGTITEETDVLNLRAVNIRNTHERPEGSDAGTLIMAGLESSRVLEAVRVTLAQQDTFKADRIADYEGKDVSGKLLRCVLSYVDYVNRYVWRK